MGEEVADPPTDDRAWHDPDGNERHVVGAKPARPSQDPGQDERRDDHDHQRDRSPTDGQIAEQVSERVELEGQDGDRHGGVSVSKQAP